MRLTAILVLALFPVLTAAGTIYRHTDAQGNVVFSDQLPEGTKAEEVVLPPLNTVSPDLIAPQSESRKEVAPQAAAPAFAGYTALTISGVGDGSMLQYPEGGLSISAWPTPGLQNGHKILLSFDGKLVSDTGSYEVQSLDRGAHTISAEIIDQDRRSLIRATDVKFDVQKHFVKKPVAKPKAK